MLLPQDCTRQKVKKWIEEDAVKKLDYVLDSTETQQAISIKYQNITVWDSVDPAYHLTAACDWLNSLKYSLHAAQYFMSYKQRS